MAEAAKQEHQAVRRMALEAEAAKSLIESLRAVGDDDDRLIVDMIEGETSLFEAIDILLGRIVETKGLLTGTEAVIADLQTRRERFSDRMKSLRAIIEQALVKAEIDVAVERPIATLSMSRRARKVEIATEADIPAEFWAPGDPRLDKKALKEALEAGRTVPGAYLTNQAPTLTTRFL